MSKICTKCLQEKPENLFSKDSRRVNGLQPKCKECNKKYRNENIERIRKRDSEYAKQEKVRAKKAIYRKSRAGKDVEARGAKTHKNKHPEKVKARRLLTSAIKSGKLIPQPCEFCGNLKVEGHHDDYSKPLEVRWLCRGHHLFVHHGEKLDKNVLKSLTFCN